MNFLWDKVTEWLKELLIGSIMSNLTGLFDNVNRQVAGIADNVGATPQAWNGGVFGMIRNLSDNVILPIAGVILALVATIAGAGAVLYGINTLRPQVVQTAASETRAQDAADTFAALVSQLENNTFGGKIFGGTGDLRAEECAFVTYTVRLKNRGFFPAEWISMELLEPAEGDVLALPDDSRHALPAGSMGDMQLTVLRRTDAQTGAARVLRVTCYVFGRKIVFDVAAADA